MTSPEATQLDFLTPSASSVAEGDGVRLGIVIDHRQFLRFVARGWLDEGSDEPLRFGVGKLLAGPVQDARIRVAVWFDSRDLKSIPAYVLRGGQWTAVSLGQVRRSDEEVAVRTPLSIRSVCRTAVATKEDSDRLIAMMRNFDNIELSTLPVDIVVGLETSNGPRQELSSQLAFPENSAPPLYWDAMRGALAMATWAIPAIDPWLDILCGSLAASSRTDRALHFVNALWWEYAPWRAEAHQASDAPALWRAALSVLHELRGAKDWRPLLVLSELENRYNQLSLPAERSPAVWKQMRDVVSNRATATNLEWGDDVLPLAITLVLLRGEPDSFATWREDWPGMPPGAWWTGAVLAGWKCGFERLSPSFRPAQEVRQRVDSWTWRLGTGLQSAELGWLEPLPASVDWRLSNNSVEFLADGKLWSERGQSNRGQWYRLDLARREALAAATLLAKHGGGECFDQVVRVKDATLSFEGEGSVSVDSAAKVLRVDGTVEFPLAGLTVLRRRLNASRFRQWLAASRIPNRLPRPPLASSRASSRNTDATSLSTTQSVPLSAEELDLFESSVPGGAGGQVPGESSKPVGKPKKRTTKLKAAAKDKWPEGLSLVEDFLSLDEEARIVGQIDDGDWQTWLSRRVQHYGWRYDYKKRRVDVRDQLGPLPNWAADLAEKLLSLGLVREMPDQVIVNEYLATQGIGKHIDCPECFRGPVVTVSLLETWAMVFRREFEGKEAKVEVPLLRASAAILDGPARAEWTHEIPKRAKESGRLRIRRVSVTFRKVAI